MCNLNLNLTREPFGPFPSRKEITALYDTKQKQDWAELSQI